jgi:uncharacterized protein YbjQ (UPF0145 family)
MLITTTDAVEGRKVAKYLGIVTAESIIGANIFRDLFAAVRDIVGGRAAGYERALGDARRMALADIEQAARELGADAIIGVDLDYEQVGQSGGMLMVSINGTAVKLA